MTDFQQQGPDFEQIEADAGEPTREGIWLCWAFMLQTRAILETIRVSTNTRDNYTAQAGDYTVTLADDTVEWTSGSHTALLPTAVGCKGKRFSLKNSGTGVITVTPLGAELIDLAALLLLSYQDCGEIESNDVGWMVI